MPEKYRVDIETTFLRFDPNDNKFYDKLCKDIPAFATFRETSKHTDNIQLRICAWVVLMYDMNTPLRREVKDMYKRKVYAGTLSGITPNTVSGKYKKFIEDMFTGQDAVINNLIVKYISSFSSPEYTQLMAHAQIQWNMLNKIISGKARKDDTAMFDNATEQIKTLTNILYGTGERDEVYEARRALYKQVAYDLSDMRPESVSRMAVDKGLPDEWSPYENGYRPDDIHFVGSDPSIATSDEM